jgi:hypothetical protein
MRCSRSLLHPATLLLTLVMSCGVPAFAQDPPDVAMGMSPSATYHSGDFDFVDMATGRLNLRIPLVVDHSQRGKLNFTYSVTFSSTGEWSRDSRGRIQPPTYGVSSAALVTEGHLYGTDGDCTYDSNNYPVSCMWWLYEDGPGVGPVHPLDGNLNGPGGAIHRRLDVLLGGPPISGLQR